MGMTVIEQTEQEQQRNVALARANQVRTARRRMREQTKAGDLDLGDVLLAPPDVLDTMSVGDVIQWAPGIGEWRMQRLVAGLARPNAKLAHLGDTTRRRIVERLRDGGEWNAYRPL